MARGSDNEVEGEVGTLRGRALKRGGTRERSELTEREPDPNKRTNQRNAEAGREGKAKGKEGRKGEKREEREANTEEKQGKGQEENLSKKHTKRRREKDSSRQTRPETAETRHQGTPSGPCQPCRASLPGYVDALQVPAPMGTACQASVLAGGGEVLAERRACPSPPGGLQLVLRPGGTVSD